MLQIVDNQEVKQENIIRMCDMQPLQIGQIVNEGFYNNHYVMRTASAHNVEVMDLTRPVKDGCWTSPILSIQVRLLNPNESITIKLFNS